MSRRDKFILVSKTGERTRAGAAAQIDRTFESLNTDHLDAWCCIPLGA